MNMCIAANLVLSFVPRVLWVDLALKHSQVVQTGVPLYAMNTLQSVWTAMSIFLGQACLV